MTPINGIAEGGVKKISCDAGVLPKAVIYDSDLTLSLPSKPSLTSGINAMAHASEEPYAQNANPIMSLLAEEGIRALAQALPEIHPESLEHAG